MKRTLISLALLGATVVGCTRRPPETNTSPFKTEETGYTLAFVFDLGPKFRDRVLGSNPTALKYALDVKDAYFRDRSESTDRLLIAQVSGVEKAVLWDGKPRTFKREFPTIKEVRDYLVTKVGSPTGPHVHTYDAVADTFDYLLKFRSGQGKRAVLVFSEMHDQSPNPAKARKHLVDSLGAYSKSGGHCAFYWLSWESCRKLELLGEEAGVKFGHFVPDAVQDPIRPTFLD